jgi:hypothetical protein
MKKLSLNVDGLQVDSFSTEAQLESRGTVRAESMIGPTAYTYCLQCGSDSDHCGTESGSYTCTRPGATCGPAQTT